MLMKIIIDGIAEFIVFRARITARRSAESAAAGVCLICPSGSPIASSLVESIYAGVKDTKRLGGLDQQIDPDDFVFVPDLFLDPPMMNVLVAIDDGAADPLLNALNVDNAADPSAVILAQEDDDDFHHVGWWEGGATVGNDCGSAHVALDDEE